MSKELLDRYQQKCNEIFEQRLITASDKDSMKLRKIVKAVAAFMVTDYKANILDLVNITGLSKSSIQRYLNEERIIAELFDNEVAANVKQGLENNRANARIKGGLNSYRNNVVVKDSDGKFVGSVPHKRDDKVEVKNEHIVKLVRIYLSEPNISLSIISKATKLSEDYIYDCLTSKRVSTLLGEDIAGELRVKLSDNAPKNIESKAK